MHFKKGDKVAVLDDQLEGWVTGFNGGQVVVQTSDGFELIVEPGELVLMDTEEMLRVSNLEAHRALKEKQKFERTPKKSAKRQKTTPPMEVDLHIEKLTRNLKGLGAYDMLELQLDTARRQLEFAIRNRIQRVVFIHGVGEGVLRKELEYLFGRYAGISFYDADYATYGLGATEVYIPQGTSLY